MKTPVELRNEGFRALCERLGMAGALRFIAEFSSGQGDYTRERRGILGKRSLSEVMRDVRRRRK